jgi:type II secretory pathway pseudopilin PulG
MSEKYQWHGKSSGLTILEVVVTIGVMGVLLAVAIPTYSAYSQQKGKVECQASVLDFLRAQELYYLDNQNFYPLRPGQKTDREGKVVRIGWEPANRLASAEEYLIPELAMGFKLDGYRGYKIRSVNLQKNDLFEQTLVFALRTNEGFHNDGSNDFEYQVKLFNRQNPSGPPEWSTHGQWRIRNGFWFNIFGCPAWKWTPASSR